jgi:hypothetical protein
MRRSLSLSFYSLFSTKKFIRSSANTVSDGPVCLLLKEECVLCTGREGRSKDAQEIKMKKRKGITEGEEKE